MGKMVYAYDTRTGEKLKNPVPQSWLDKGIFPHLSTTPRQRSNQTPAKTEKKEG